MCFRERNTKRKGKGNYVLGSELRMVKFYRLLNKFVFGLLLNFNYLIIMILYFEDFPVSYILQNSAWQRSKGNDLSPHMILLNT